MSIWENIYLLCHPADTAVIASPHWRELHTVSIQALVNLYQTNYICKLLIIRNIKGIMNIKGIYINLKAYFLVVSHTMDLQ